MDTTNTASPESGITSLDVAKIRTDGGTQARASMDEGVVAEYASQIKDGQKAFPAMVAFHDGTDYWLADGFHRLRAYKRAGWPAVSVDVRIGTQRDAILYACGANANHGLRRTNADKRLAVRRLLEDGEWSKWSDREIARRCGVDNKFVGNVRGVLRIRAVEGTVDRPQLNQTPTPQPAERTYTRKGKTSTMRTGKIGKSAKKSDATPAQDTDELKFEKSPVAWMNRCESAVEMATWVPFETCPRTEKMLAAVNRVIEQWTDLKLKLEKSAKKPGGGSGGEANSRGHSAVVVLSKDPAEAAATLSSRLGPKALRALVGEILRVDLELSEKVAEMDKILARHDFTISPIVVRKLFNEIKELLP